MGCCCFFNDTVLCSINASTLHLTSKKLISHPTQTLFTTTTCLHVDGIFVKLERKLGFGDSFNLKQLSGGCPPEHCKCEIFLFLFIENTKCQAEVQR